MSRSSAQPLPLLGGEIVETFPNPCYVLHEDRLRRNLDIIRRVQQEAGVEIILALKAFALWRTFPIFRDYIRQTTASSLYEARLSAEEFGALTSTYSPAYEEESFNDILRCSRHVVFNSLGQLERFRPMAQAFEASPGGHAVSLGLRVNPGYSEIETDLYNPCADGSRFGVRAGQLPATLPDGVEGLHFHCLCENDATTLVHVLEHLERRFAPWLKQAKWVNMGGGHLMTRQGYHLELLIDTLRRFRERWPNLKVMLEPGSAFLWQTGDLHARVVDIVCNEGVRTAILNVSFTCHMPDCLEMPYWPKVTGAESLPEPEQRDVAALAAEPGVCRLGGNSCLSGDFMGLWRFNRPLQVGDEVVLEDMIHYTTVKTNMFNGIAHPAIGIQLADGRRSLLRRYGYEDYRDRMC